MLRRLAIATTTRIAAPVNPTDCHMSTMPRVAIRRPVISKNVAAMPVPRAERRQ
jgi:hypothetical protein